MTHAALLRIIYGHNAIIQVRMLAQGKGRMFQTLFVTVSKTALLDAIKDLDDDSLTVRWHEGALIVEPEPVVVNDNSTAATPSGKRTRVTVVPPNRK